MGTQTEFKSRIIEISFKDRDNEYFPQIHFEFYKKDEWLWLRKEELGDKYVLCANDYKCACKTIKEAIEKIKIFEKQREEFRKANIKCYEIEKQREESIKEINIIEKY